jgi:hypothetical protein
MEQLGSANLAIFAQQLLPNPKYLHRPRFPHSKVKGGKILIFIDTPGPSQYTHTVSKQHPARIKSK